jgi:hypothetical protein
VKVDRFPSRPRTAVQSVDHAPGRALERSDGPDQRPESVAWRRVQRLADGSPRAAQLARWQACAASSARTAPGCSQSSQLVGSAPSTLVQRKVTLDSDGSPVEVNVEEAIEWLKRSAIQFSNGAWRTAVRVLVEDSESRSYPWHYGQSKFAEAIQEWLASSKFVISSLAPLYDAAVGGNIALGGLFRYAKVKVAAQPASAYPPGCERVFVEVAAGRFPGRQGWIDLDCISDQFPGNDDFEIPNIKSVVPPLYHGSSRQSIDQIREGGFVVSSNVAAGRTYGDGVYATPYVSKAAHHAANTVLSQDKAEFAVAEVKPRRKVDPGQIMIHDMLRENDLLNGNLSMFDAVKAQHGEHFAKVAEALCPPKLPISYKEITKAARTLGFQIIIYRGEPGHVVYVFPYAYIPVLKGIVIEGVNPNSTGNWQDLDWYHEAQERDRNQREMNLL